MKKLLGLFIIIICIGNAGCTRSDQGAQRFLLPWPDKNGESKLQIVQIESLNSPYEISGPAAQVYFQSAFSAGGFIGDPVKPQLAVVDGVFVPKDVNSSMGLVLYAQMERIWKMDQRLQIDKGLPWPRKIGYEIRAADDDGNLEFNNARDYSDGDVVAFMPMSLANTPLSVNPGILAHEHFHAHFNYRVLKFLPEKNPLSAVETFNEEVILRGWNEGLADYYGFVFSDNSDFIKMSLGGHIGENRKVSEQDVNVIRSANFFYEYFNKLTASGSSVGGLGYLIGTDLARTLYHLVEVGGEAAPISTHQKMLKFVVDRLERVPAWYLVQATDEKVEPAQLLEILFFDEISVLTQTQCEALFKLASYYFEDKNLRDQCLKSR